MSDEKSLKDFEALAVAVAREEATLPACETMGGITLRSHILTLRELASTAAAERARDVAAERKRRGEGLALAERQDAAHMEARKTLVARAEQAERERDETLRMWREYKAAKDADVASADAARERAEAGNAARIDAIQRARNLLLYPAVPWDEAVPEVLRVLALVADDHPGAAPLERMRALETAARILLERKEQARRYDPSVAHEWKALADALETK